MLLGIKLELKDIIILEELLEKLEQMYDGRITDKETLGDMLANYIDNIETEYYFLWKANENIILDALINHFGFSQKED